MTEAMADARELAPPSGGAIDASLECSKTWRAACGAQADVAQSAARAASEDSIGDAKGQSERPPPLTLSGQAGLVWLGTRLGAGVSCVRDACTCVCLCPVRVLHACLIGEMKPWGAFWDDVEEQHEEDEDEAEARSGDVGLGVA